MLNMKQIILINFCLFISVYTISIGNQAIIQKQFSIVLKLSREFKLLQIKEPSLSDSNQQNGAEEIQAEIEEAATEEVLSDNNQSQSEGQSEQQNLEETIDDQIEDRGHHEDDYIETETIQNEEDAINESQNNPEQGPPTENSNFEQNNGTESTANFEDIFQEVTHVIETNPSSDSEEIIELITDYVEDVRETSENETDQVQNNQNLTNETAILQDVHEERQELLEEHLHPELPLSNQTENNFNNNSSVSEKLNGTTNYICNKTLECSQNYSQELLLKIVAIEESFQTANQQVAQAQANLEQLQNQAKLIAQALEDIKQQLNCSHQANNQSEIAQEEEVEVIIQHEDEAAREELNEVVNDAIEQQELISEVQEEPAQTNIQTLEIFEQGQEELIENNLIELSHNYNQGQIGQTQLIQKRLQQFSQTKQSTI
ncbi:UNKNOWN [Stylonychia lemnae]|uniref:Transmembrane protein n=1 Tax=Stylonychia lemnae TaxID=5949 RepID=A0A077ZPP1_STYLE|nr:UNKNOWN [Stylonychia lemnae]|eukprot:CDW71863.1 UNKNOWN [Stylonychia lemnae]